MRCYLVSTFFPFLSERSIQIKLESMDKHILKKGLKKGTAAYQQIRLKLKLYLVVLQVMGGLDKIVLLVTYLLLENI